MQLYTGLPIITNKVNKEEMRGVRHHLLGEIKLEEDSLTVGGFVRRAKSIIGGIRGRGKLPILCGGTAYYLQSLVFGESLVSEEREEHMNVEDIKEKWPILEGSTEDMLEMLREVDQVMADRWHPKDRRKIRRSLEIFLMTGKKASDVYREQVERKTLKNGREGVDEGVDLSSVLLFWVHADSEVLKKRLDGRVDKMLKNGLLDEVQTMDKFLHDQEQNGQVVDRTRGIWVSIGYKEFEPYLQTLKSSTASEKELKDAFDLSVEQTKAATRQYAKRQIRWIRLKMLPGLKEENALKQLYLLDGTDIEKWDTNVSDMAVEITEDFLAGRELPDPETICGPAKEILGEAEVGEIKTEWPRRECEMCGVIAVTEVQWDTHIKSRKHRGLVKRKLKKERDIRPISENEKVSSEGEDSP